MVSERTFLSTQEHLNRFLTLRDDDPVCFYLLGRWCYEVRWTVESALIIEASVRHLETVLCVCVCICV